MGRFSAGDVEAAGGVDARVTRTRRDVLAASIDELIDGGWDSVTHARVAARAGYSKATVYSHWPDRLALVRDAFAQLGKLPHFEPTGDVRVDLIGELTSFRNVMTTYRLHRVLAILAERSIPVPELAEVRDAFVRDGEDPLRRILRSVVDGNRLEVATFMLCGAIVHPVLLHGHIPADDEIAIAVDMVMDSIDLRGSSRLAPSA